MIFAFILQITACKSKENQNVLESGELVVLEDTSDINLGIYDFDTLNPLTTKSKSVKRILNAVYEPLFSVDEKMNIISVLAKGYTLSEKGQKLTIDLNTEIKWQDGTNFTADDVVYTISKMRSCDGFYNKIASKIHAYTAVNKYQIIINLTETATDFAYNLNFPIIQKATHFLTDSGFTPIGTGAYKFTSKNSNMLYFEPNSLWHGSGASKKKINVKILKDSDACANAFNVNEVDAVTSDEINLQSNMPKGKSVIKSYVSNKMVFLGFNTAYEKLVSPNIRQAINHLINKADIIEKDAYGQGVPADIAINPSSWAYKSLDYSNLPEDYLENLFTKDGYALHNGVYYKDGSVLSVGILVNSDNQQKVKIAERIAEELNSAGISAYLTKVGYEEYVNRISSDQFEAFIGEIETEQGINPAVMLNTDNYFNFDITAIGDTMNQLSGVSDKETLKNGINEFTQRFYANPPYIPLFFRTESVIFGSYVSGAEEPTVACPFRSIEKWYFYDKDGKEQKKFDENTPEPTIQSETEKEEQTNE